MTAYELKKRQRIRKRNRCIKKTICIIAVICACVLIAGAVKGRDRVITGYEYKSTGTLWGLLEYCPEDMDRWEYLDLVMELNGMKDETVRADRLYRVPMFE